MSEELEKAKQKLSELANQYNARAQQLTEFAQVIVEQRGVVKYLESIEPAPDVPLDDDGK